MDVVVIGPSETAGQAVLTSCAAHANAEFIVAPERHDAWVLFKHLCRELDDSDAGRRARSGCMSDVLGVIDGFSSPLFAEAFDPIQVTASSAQTWPSAAAMLVLAHPEVHWVVAVRNDTKRQMLYCDANEKSAATDRLLLNSLHLVTLSSLASRIPKLIELVSAGSHAIFDGGGLREVIRRRAIVGMEKRQERKTQSWKRLDRDKVCEVDDEEGNFAYLNAYTLYLHGYRVLVCTSETTALRLFGPPEKHLLDGDTNRFSLCLGLHDRCLNFPDKSDAKASWSKFPNRNKLLPILAAALGRDKKVECPLHRGVVITYGNRKANGGEPKETCADHKEADGTGQWVIYKPTEGIYDLAHQLGLGAQIWRDEAARAKEPPCCGLPPERPSFEWPPPKFTDMEDGTSHSAPGRMLAIAERLMARAHVIRSGGPAPKEAFIGAVMAFDAQTLLLDLTTTSGLEALELRMTLEIHGECRFLGSSYRVSTERRLEQLEKEVRYVTGCITDSDKKRRDQYLDAHESIVNSCVRTYRDLKQFDEEEACLAKARDIHVQQQHPHRTAHTTGLSRLVAKLCGALAHARPITTLRKYPKYYVIRYATWTLASMGHFLFAIAVVPLICAVLLWQLQTCGGSCEVSHADCLTEWRALHAAFNAFITLNMPENFPLAVAVPALSPNWWQRFLQDLVLVFAATAGVFHLGLFVSKVVTLLERK